jgi:threonine aldolase
MTTLIDLRSDTVTQPTPAMRQAMANARVGDDVYGDDPTVNELEALAATKTGKEAGLFVPSGTMGNLIALLTHCGRGDEAILGARAHTVLYEGGGISALGGIHPRQIMEQPDGSLALEDIESVLRPADDHHQPPSRLVSIENTHNRCGGTYQTPAYLASLSAFAQAHQLATHMDGARVFNAAAAQGLGVRELTRHVDSVTFCLSKGLCAPVGSVLCGTETFIARARHYRKHLGGGMRQAGIIAAAGIVALNEMTERLREDHARARTLAEGLSEIPQIRLDPGTPATNMIFFNLRADVRLAAEEIEQKMAERGILVHSTGARRFRLVTHYWVDDAAVEQTVAAWRAVLTI